ncbi:MAG: hypothetical protein NZ769_11320 [Anaerolineae bacterium]|nr:hypothetical protein [Anaerolineae bacterium]MCX8066255.1 hypothetical protein [Anaerolineae bacterium]
MTVGQLLRVVAARVETSPSGVLRWKASSPTPIPVWWRQKPVRAIFLKYPVFHIPRWEEADGLLFDP